MLKEAYGQAQGRGVVRTPVVGADLGTPAKRDQTAACRHCTPGAIGEQLEARLLRVLHQEARSHPLQPLKAEQTGSPYVYGAYAAELPV